MTGGAKARAIAPAGASTGSGEALDRRDGGDAFGGYDVTQAIHAVDQEIAPALKGLDATDQAAIDQCLIDLDGTPARRASAPMLQLPCPWRWPTPPQQQRVCRSIAISPATGN